MIEGKVKQRSCVGGRAVRQRSVNLWKGGAVKQLNAQRREDYMIIGKKNYDQMAGGVIEKSCLKGKGVH